MRHKFTLLSFLEIFAFFLTIVLLFLVVTQVLGRYVLSTLPEWSSEESTLLFLMWLCAVGSSIGSAVKGHLSVDALVKIFPRNVQRVIEIAIYVLITVFLAVVFYMTARLAWLNRATTTPRLSIPMIVIQASIPFAMIVMLYYNVKYFILSFFRKGDTPK